MARLDVEFIDESCGFIAANEDVLERKIYDRINQNDYTKLSASEYEQLSGKRKGVLEWYPFREKAKLLELGAGMGALTELFVKKKCIVTSVEIKKSRARIIERRFQNNENVNVICDNPVLFETEEKYDYIVVHDIWGYVKKYKKSDEAYNFFLSKIKQFLNPDGHFIVIADNRMALKYFSGNIDEYSRKLFVGVNNYKNYSYIKSFDKKEILDMLTENDMCPKDIYYVNSDYYFADKIYTDYALQNVRYIGRNTSTTYNGFSLFDSQEVYDALQKNEIADRFVDAFIIDCYCQKENGMKMVYYQAGNSDMNGVAVFCNENKLLMKSELTKQELQFNQAKTITIDEWRRIVTEYNIYDDELKRYLKNNMDFPLINPVDILKFGLKDNMHVVDDETLQLVEEERLIQSLIGELYENKQGSISNYRTKNEII